MPPGTPELFQLYPIPAPGYRHYVSGISGGNGNAGFSWSCTPDAGDVMARYLDFNMQYLNPNRTYYRTHGFQLRCLSE